MTLYNQETDDNSSDPGSNSYTREMLKRPFVQRSKSVEPVYERSPGPVETMETIHWSLEGRLVTTESQMEVDAADVHELYQLDSASLFRGEMDEQDMTKLCDKLDSVDMKIDQVTGHLCFDEIDVADTISNNVYDNLDPEDLYSQDKDGDTVLHSAIILQETALIMACIRKAPSYTWLSLRNHIFQTPLHLAVLTKQPDVVRKLVTSGADITSQDNNGNTPLHIACRDGDMTIARKLLSHVKYPEAAANSYEIPYQKMPQDFNITNYEGKTCLHLAVENGHHSIVKMLMENDVDLNMREVKTGRTILHNACINNDLPLVRLLLSHKSCNMNAQAYDGLTPFDVARSWRNDVICTVLSAAGARYGGDDVDSD